MASFKFINQRDGTNTYDGPSGTRYVINLGHAFKVDIKEDVEFFRSKPSRFQEQNMINTLADKISPPIQQDVEELLMEELNKIKGLTKKSKENIVHLYMSKKDLMVTIEMNHNPDPSINAKDWEKVKEHMIKLAEEEPI